jgi:hypothetical protein
MLVTGILVFTLPAVRALREEAGSSRVRADKLGNVD